MSQLPLSDKIKAFPKLNSSCFIIANLDCSIIINEHNSNKQIHTGTFDDVIFYSKLNLTKESNSSLGNNKLTLYEMNNILFNKLKLKLYNFQTHYANANISIIKSAMSGYGCVYSYENKNNGNYIGILYGCKSQEEVFNDIKNITNWIKQFYILDTSGINQNFIEVPLLYGQEKTIKLTEKKRKILISKFSSGKIERIYHYRTIVSAPIKKGDVLGIAFYFSETFRNPIKIPLLSTKSMKKSSLFRRIADTIHYIIFGNTSKNKDPFQNILE